MSGGLNLYAGDFSSRLIEGLTASDGNKSMWPGYLTGYLSYNAAGNKVSNAQMTPYIAPRDRVMDCPARPQIPADIGMGNQGYGMPEPDTYTKRRNWAFFDSVKINGTSGTLKMLVMSRVAAPGRILLLADCTTDTPAWRYGSMQQGSLANFTGWGISGNYGGVIQLYHSELANGLFFDGHVDARDAGRLYGDPDTHVRTMAAQDFTILPQLPDY